MASRGFQGDTVSTLLMIGAGVLVWNKLSSAADKGATKAAEVLGIGENTAGVFQTETSEEINQYEAEVKSWHCDWRALGAAGKARCKAIANKIYQHVNANSGYTSNIDEDYLIGLCKPLSANELRAVAILYDTKDYNNFFGFTVFSGHIFHLFDEILSDSMMGGNDLTTMKGIWAKTGLWL